LGLNEFLGQHPDSGKPVPYGVLAELSGISSDEAARLATGWERWPIERVRELLVRLSDLIEDDARVEFEAVFKAGLYSTDGKARSLAVAGLAGCGDRSVIGRVVEILATDEFEEARVAAAMTLANLCSLARDGKLHRRDGERLSAALTGVLEKENETVNVRRRALEAVAVFPGSRVERLIEAAATGEEPLMRQSALFAMGRTSDPRWLGYVIGEMDSPEAAIRFEATLALGQIADFAHPQHARHLGQLEAVLDDTDLDVQVAAVTTLQNIGGEDARALLRAAVESPEPAVAKAAREALGALRDEDELLDDVSGGLPAGAASMYGGIISDDWNEDDEYVWDEHEVHPDNGEGHVDDPGGWPRNN